MVRLVLVSTTTTHTSTIVYSLSRPPFLGLGIGRAFGFRLHYCRHGLSQTVEDTNWSVFCFRFVFFCRQSIGLFEILCIETCGGYWRLPRRLTSWIRPATAIFIKWKSKGCGGYWRLTRRLPLNSVLLLWFYRKVVVYTRLNILLLKECMHHLGVKILEFSPGGAGETFTNQRQQTFMMQNEAQKKLLVTIVGGL